MDLFDDLEEVLEKGVARRARRRWGIVSLISECNEFASLLGGYKSKRKHPAVNEAIEELRDHVRQTIRTLRAIKRDKDKLDYKKS